MAGTLLPFVYGGLTLGLPVGSQGGGSGGLVGSGNLTPLGSVLANGTYDLVAGSIKLSLVPMAQPGQPAPPKNERWTLELTTGGFPTWNFQISPVPSGYAGTGTVTFPWNGEGSQVGMDFFQGVDD